MNFLDKLGFSTEDINDIKANIPSLIIDQLEKASDLVTANINYLIELGVTNYKEAFMAYYDMFLMDTDAFEGVFNKYDREDLIKKIEKNVAIIEHL